MSNFVSVRYLTCLSLLSRSYSPRAKPSPLTAKSSFIRSQSSLRSSLFFPVLPLLFLSLSTMSSSTAASSSNDWKQPSEEEWKKKLTPFEYSVLREKATERPHVGEYTKTKDEGVYHCKGCDAPLYKSSTKFDSGCGWPAFYDAIPDAIKELPDADGRRVEIVCARCGGHMGHVFKGEGFPTPTDERHCVNSISVKLKKK